MAVVRSVVAVRNMMVEGSAIVYRAECDGRVECDYRGECGGSEKCDGGEEHGGGKGDVWQRYGCALEETPMVWLGKSSRDKTATFILLSHNRVMCRDTS